MARKKTEEEKAAEAEARAEARKGAWETDPVFDPVDTDAYPEVPLHEARKGAVHIDDFHSEEGQALRLKHSADYVEELKEGDVAHGYRAPDYSEDAEKARLAAIAAALAPEETEVEDEPPAKEE